MKDFSNVKNNLRFYGGNAEPKLGFKNSIGENWFLKFPKSTKNLENVEMSYTRTPLSEYIGSKIYEVLGIPVHETELGIFGEKVVVACKDFIADNEQLIEIKNLANLYLRENERERENLSSNNSYQINIEELNFLFKENEYLNFDKKIEERFWDMFVVDSFLNNNDRHNGNWGLIKDSFNNLKLSPVYDNGNSFFSKHTDEKLKNNLSNIDMLVSNGRTPFLYKNKKVDSVKVIKNLSFRDNNLNFKDTPEDKFLKETSLKLRASLEKIVEKIDIKKINEIIDSIPEEFKGVKIITPVTKSFYKEFLNKKYENILLPALKKIKNS